MWYKQILAQFGGGVNWPDEKPVNALDSENHYKIDAC